MASFNSQPIFSRRSLGGLAGVALASLLAEEGLLATEANDPLAPKTTHFPPRAKSCIFLFMNGGPSQLDLFTPKPVLNRLAGEPIPASIADVQLAFAQKDTARLMGSPFQFRKHGASGLEFSELLPQLATCADDLTMIRTLQTDSVNHLPAQIMMNTGFNRFGRPTLGSWLLYGMGNESRNLPGYVVLSNGEDNGSANWSSGFLPSNFSGVAFRNQGAPILHLENPVGLPTALHSQSMRALSDLNRQEAARTGDAEILSRIANYELAFRMQTSAPELIDLSSETAATRAAYGLDRAEEDERVIARNCLLARRLVERGVRFINIYHGDWDSHFNLVRQHKQRCAAVDQPVTALIRDLKARGLLDDTLVVWASEFGRTPIGENRAQRSVITGRDHHIAAFTVLLAGGGVPGGTAIGETDEIGWAPISDTVHIHDFHATLLRIFGFDHTRLTYRHLGRDFRLTDVRGRIVPQVVGEAVRS